MADSPKPQHHSINYIELPMRDVAATKAFYGGVFGWTFQEWGDSYVSFHGAGIDGGFDLAGLAPAQGSAALVVLYSKDLETSYAAVKAAGGEICKEIFSFPGGRRFHFIDPNGNELSIWTF